MKAVRNISFDIYKGETLAIVGESGSGKSVTSKAIMGILAGNSIVENGEIIYDGQDLLKISEEDFHKLRGDKIAMIFQDPMSSLNPIMRIGQQLTEAMILKAKTGKKNARNAFNAKLKSLKASIIEANQGEDSATVAYMIKQFDEFCIMATKIEREYNEAYGNVMQLEMDIDKCLLMLERQKKVDIVSELKHFRKLLIQSYNPYLISRAGEGDAYAAKLSELITAGKNADRGLVMTALRDGLALAKNALEKEKPNFFTLGYYQMVDPEADLTDRPVDEMNRMTREFLDKQFMLSFISMAEKGVTYSHKASISKKQECMGPLEEALAYFKNEKITERKSKAYAKQLSSKVLRAIDRLTVKKESIEYVFPSALNSAIDAYFDGVKKNPPEEKKYLKKKAKYDAIVKRGKEPDWKLAAPVLVDLDLKRANICRVIENLYNHYRSNLEKDIHFNANAQVVETVDFLKDQASRFVVKMNKRIAKAKAIKLMEEVGIPEPATRFRQYPFEFSGGMRQRIVIAIALSANPDILICDEPTTALDVTIQAQILELINDIKQKRNLSVIFITHNMGVVANMADRIAVMYAGKIVEYGTAEEIFYEPAHPYTWALLSSMPDLQTTERLESIPGTPPNMIYPPKGDAFAARNKYAMEIDFEVEPPLFEITESHHAATWLLHPNAPKVEMPQLIKSRIERMKKEREANGNQQ